ncbi:MAG: hypothetical protein RL133_553 [Pseudomonadota bacterium]
MQVFLPKWPSSHGVLWVLGIGLAYVVVWWLNSLTPAFLEVVEDRVSLIHLPAFIRVAAVMIGGVAGWLGVWLGAFFISAQLVGDAPLAALMQASATTMSVGIAAVLVATAQGKRSGCLNSINLKSMLLIALFAAILNAALHSLVWAAHEVTLTHAQFWMMVAGDLGGVALGYLILRWTVRQFRRRAA